MKHMPNQTLLLMIIILILGTVNMAKINVRPEINKLVDCSNTQWHYFNRQRITTARASGPSSSWSKLQTAYTVDIPKDMAILKINFSMDNLLNFQTQWWGLKMVFDNIVVDTLFKFPYHGPWLYVTPTTEKLSGTIADIKKGKHTVTFYYMSSYYFYDLYNGYYSNGYHTLEMLGDMKRN